MRELTLHLQCEGQVRRSGEWPERVGRQAIAHVLCDERKYSTEHVASDTKERKAKDDQS